MKKILLFILLFTTPVHACVIPTSSKIIHMPEKYLEHYDFVAYAELIEFIDLTKEQQIVEFSINKIFKGAEINSIVVNNYFNNSCSRGFSNKNAYYYLFLTKNNSNGNYSVDSGTFVKVSDANQHQLDAKLSAHSKAPKSSHRNR